MCIYSNLCSYPNAPYCWRHKKLLGIKDSLKAKKPIPKFTAKTKDDAKVLKAELDLYKLQDGSCKVKSPICTGKAQGWHHIQKTSPKNKMLKENRVAACNACNSIYIEQNREWAEKNGFLISRFKK